MNDPVLLFCAPIRWIHHLVTTQPPSDVALYLGLTALAGMHDAGGFVRLPQPLPVARVPKPRKAMARLIAAGLVDQVTGGVQIVDYRDRTEHLLLEHLRTEQRREAGRLSGEVRRAGVPAGQLRVPDLYAVGSGES